MTSAPWTDATRRLLNRLPLRRSENNTCPQPDPRANSEPNLPVKAGLLTVPSGAAAAAENGMGPSRRSAESVSPRSIRRSFASSFARRGSNASQNPPSESPSENPNYSSSRRNSAPPTLPPSHITFDPTPTYTPAPLDSPFHDILPPSYHYMTMQKGKYNFVSNLPKGITQRDVLQVFVFDDSREVGFAGSGFQMGTRIKMPDDADLRDVRATVAHGVLTVTVGKLPADDSNG